MINPTIPTEKQFECFCSQLTMMPANHLMFEALLTDPNYLYPQRDMFMTMLQDLPYFVWEISHYPRHLYRFSPSIEALLTTLDQCGLPVDYSLFSNACQSPYHSYAYRSYLVNLLMHFQSILMSPALKSKRIELQYEVQHNYNELLDYIDRLFSHHSKLLVLRVDLSYQKDCQVSFETLEADLKRFHNNRRHNALLNEMIGYVTKIEYGIDKKLHVHGLFIFNGNKHQQDINIAQYIGEYWSGVITAGNGTYWNCNANKKSYVNLGIGEIHYRDAEKRENLNDSMAYLCKKGMQIIKPHNAPMTKLLRKGQCKLADSTKGRPRNEAIESLFD